MSTQVQIPDEMRQRFDELAAYFGQPREQVILGVLEDYLQQIAEEDARIDEARAQIARGEVVDADEADAEMEALLLAQGITAQQLAALREEAAREADTFYDVSSCE